MLKSQMRFAGKGEDSSLLVFTPPAEARTPDVENSCMAIPVLPRDGGLLIALPSGFIASDVLLGSAESDASELFGPSQTFSGAFIEEDELGQEVSIGLEASFVILDVTDQVLPMLRDYDPVIDPSSEIFPFARDRSLAIIDLPVVVPQIFEWLRSAEGLERMVFYSAREEQVTPMPAQTKATPKRAGARKVTTAALADQIAELVTQVQAIAAQQQSMMSTTAPASATLAPEPAFGTAMPARLPSVSAGLPQRTVEGIPKIAQLLGPPPKAKPPAAALSVYDAEEPSGAKFAGQNLEGMGVSQALMQQSQAITSLVAHLTSGDALTELGSQGLHTKGVARREKMQGELAGGTSNFFLQVRQQIHKRMFPSRPLPKDESDLVHSGATLCGYLEKFGGYKNRPETAMIMWLLGHTMDSMALGDDRMAREYLALTVACIEQSVVDGGWNLAYVLSLLEEPPSQVFTERQGAISSLGKPFAALVPPTWSAVSLAYLKELDLLSSKKAEARNPKAPAPKNEEGHPPSPKRKPKFPKKPKGGDSSPSN